MLATFGVFLFHCLMFFNPFPWHVKNNILDTSSILILSLFLGIWLMPLFFVISGISSALALKKRSVSSFLKDRLLRIGVPLILGIFLLSPPQVYIERVSNGAFNGTFIDFFPLYFNGVYLDFGQSGNFAFHGLHLWYLLVLLVFSLWTALLIKVLPPSITFRPVYLALLPLLMFMSGMTTTVALGGWDILFYLIVFTAGYYFFSSEDFMHALAKTVKIWIPAAVISTVLVITWFMVSPPVSGSLAGGIYFLVRTLSCFSIMCCIFFFGKKYLSSSNKLLKYGGEASLPFYILHQPVIVIIGYFIKDLSWALPVKLIFLILMSFAVIWVIYHQLIRRFNILRFLFGMKTVTNSKPAVKTAV